jgi:SAM-dependent methyltransferase
MLEKIGTPGHEMISTPDATVRRLLVDCLAMTPDPVYYEVGVGIGATAVEVARTLANRGKMFLFSREHDVRELKADLEALGFTNVNGDWASPRNTFSGYHFELAYGFLRGELPPFDLAYLDGGHVFHLDAPAACVLKELCKPGGHIVFDDWSWSLERSVGLNPKTRPATAVEYDPRQIRECHVPMVCRTVMDTDPRFRFLGLESDSAIYRRVG